MDAGPTGIDLVRLENMASLQEMMDDHGGLAPDDQEWLKGLANEWHVLADTSFSDLVLWLPDRTDDAIFWAIAQIRPTTGPTALEEDVVGESIVYDDEHSVTGAYLSHDIVETSTNQLNAGIPVDTWAVPIMHGDTCIAVLERHTNRMGVRAPGALEDWFLTVADILTDMVHRRAFPVFPASEPNLSPKVADGLVVLTPGGVVRYASPNAVTAYRRMGYVGDLEGEPLMAITQGLGLDLDQVGQTFASDLESGQVHEVNLTNRRASARLRAIPMTLGEDPAGVLVLVKDTTEIQERERQLVTKDATIREIHHRVKNNLQTVAALLRLQSRRVHNEEARAALHDSMNRVAAIAVVHELLSQAHTQAVEFDDIADRILRMVGDVSTIQGEVTTRREGSFGLIPAAVATSLSLVVTELCQNAAEHGLNFQEGEVLVRPDNRGDQIVVDVLDSGPGLAPDYEERAQHSLGLSIVRTLVSDVGGTFTLTNRDEGPDAEPDVHGTRARVVMPLK